MHHYRSLQKYFDILIYLGVDHQCDVQTDKQTDRTIAPANDAR